MDEENLPTLIIRNDYVLAGLYHGSVQVEAGICTIIGTLQGQLTIFSGATVHINGLLQGNMHVYATAKVIVMGSVQGNTRIDSGSTLTIEETGSLEGLLLNDGEVIIRGIISGGQVGNGNLLLEGKGYIKTSLYRDGAFPTSYD